VVVFEAGSAVFIRSPLPFGASVMSIPR
jgi:hypothetical protein